MNRVPAQYARNRYPGGFENGHFKRFIEDQTAARLSWRYGPQRAAEILAGNDPEANADLAAWRKLGAPK